MVKEEEARSIPPAPPTPAARASSRDRKRWVVPALAAGLVLSIALAATFVALWASSVDTSSEDVGEFMNDQRPVAERRALEVINLLMNYDSTNIDEVADRMLQISTGNFRQDYEETFSAGLGEAIEKVSASSRGQVLNGPEISFRSGSEALAIARVTQTTQNDENPQGNTFNYVMEITLIDTTDGGWKADRVELLSGQEG
ncbi:MAG: hypothetical protein ACRDJS_08320 [Actinomycetota bacterium]